jgi:hypothetical protein
MFLGLPDPHLDPLDTSTDPDLDPYLSHKSVGRTENNGCKIKFLNFNTKIFLLKI